MSTNSSPQQHLASICSPTQWPAAIDYHPQLSVYLVHQLHFLVVAAAVVVDAADLVFVVAVVVVAVVLAPSAVASGDPHLDVQPSASLHWYQV